MRGSRIFRASSGSRSASSSIEPFRSAKSTVTCLRSPSSAVFEVRIFSQVLGRTGLGDLERSDSPASTGWEPGAGRLDNVAGRTESLLVLSGGGRAMIRCLRSLAVALGSLLLAWHA